MCTFVCRAPDRPSLGSSADNELRGHDDGFGVLPRNAAQQQIYHGSRAGLDVLSNCGQRRVCLAGNGQVIKANQPNLIRQTHAHFGKLMKASDANCIRRRENAVIIFNQGRQIFRDFALHDIA